MPTVAAIRAGMTARVSLLVLGRYRPNGHLPVSTAANPAPALVRLGRIDGAPAAGTPGLGHVRMCGLTDCRGLGVTLPRDVVVADQAVPQQRELGPDVVVHRRGELR